MAEPARILATERPWPPSMTRETGAAFLEVSTSTFDKLVDEGKLPLPVHVPGTRLVRWNRDRLWAAFLAWEEGQSDDDVALAE